MSKKKVKATCLKCGTHDGLFITFANGERLPSYVIEIGKGIKCMECYEKEKVSA